MVRGGWLLAVMLALTACQGTPPPRQAAPQTEPDTAALAAIALERGDYERAYELYQSALLATPDSVPLHYGVGVSMSFLNRKAEAVRELVWVLEHGDPGSSEVRAARLWLKSVKALPAAESGATTATAQEEQTAEQKKDTMATVHGRVVFGETSTDAAPKGRMQLFLMEHPSRVNYFRIRTDEQGNFNFENVPPGVYKLTDRAAGHAIWRLRVELKPGQDLSLDLSPANSTRVRDDFPEAALADGVHS
jgi:carboxypeptidase family protein